MANKNRVTSIGSTEAAKKLWKKPSVSLLEVSMATQTGQFTDGGDEDNFGDPSRRGVYHPSP